MMFKRTSASANCIVVIAVFGLSFAFLGCSKAKTANGCTTLASVVSDSVDKRLSVKFDNRSKIQPLSGGFFADGSTELTGKIGTASISSTFYQDGFFWTSPPNGGLRIVAIARDVPLVTRTKIIESYLSSQCALDTFRPGSPSLVRFAMPKGVVLSVEIGEFARDWAIETFSPPVCTEGGKYPGVPECGRATFPGPELGA